MKKTLFALVMSFFLIGSIVPVKSETTVHEELRNEVPTIEERPYASHFFPSDFLEWDFNSDADAIHNVSTVPLNKRVQGEKVNLSQSTEAKVASLAITNKNTSGTPSQGSSKKEIYNFTNWQYVDVLVGWAGSAGEGIIVPPSSDVIDVAHRNGVPVLGTVFFPPLAYGGQIKWLDEFLIKDEDGKFPMADKLIEMAKLYGFDGWFINQETSSENPKHGKLFSEFLTYYQNIKPSDHDVMWYDSMLENGAVKWQNELNENNQLYFQEEEQKKSDKLFLNFWWKNKEGVERLKNSSQRAMDLGRSPYDVFAGIDVQAKGHDSLYLPSDIYDGEKAMLSLGLYAADWTLRDGAKENVDKYWENEKDFWINKVGDPRDTSIDDTQWQGISRYFVEKSAVTKLPFITDFNTGHGDNQYRNGVIIKSGTFNNRSIQDILPTYRWIIDQKENELSASFEYEHVFNGGTSVKFSGPTIQDAISNVKLYATDLDVQEGTKANIVYKGDASVNLVLNEEVLHASSKENINGWTKATYELSNMKIKTIGVEISADSTSDNSDIYLGNIAIIDNETYQVEQVEDYKVIGKSIDDNVIANLRVSWKHSGQNTSKYNIYTDVGNGWEFQGSTSNRAYYIESIHRGTSSKVQLKAVPVDLNGNEVDAATALTSFSFDEIDLPKGSFDISSTFVKTEDEISIKANASSSTEKISWKIDGATVLKETGNEVIVSFDKAGIYNVEMILENSAGKTVVKQSKVISVYDEKFAYDLENLALNLAEENIQVSNSCAAHEAGPGATDGKMDTKWCDNKSDKPTMILELSDKASIVGFKIHHAEAGGENREWNTRDYQIFTSHDGSEWEEVVHRDDNEDAVSFDSISLTEAKYVKLQLNKAEQTGNTARIYEFEVLGYNGLDIKVHPLQDEINELRTTVFDIDVDFDKYTDETVKILKQYLDKAYEVLDNNGFVSDKIVEADYIRDLIQKIEESINNLVNKVDLAKNTLSELVKELLTIDSGKYESESYKNMMNQIILAKQLLSDDNATEEEINKMVEQLQIARDGLQLKEDDNNILPPESETETEKEPSPSDKPQENQQNNVDEEKIDNQNKPNTGKLPSTGKGNIILYSALGITMLGLIIVLVNKQKKIF